MNILQQFSWLIFVEFVLKKIDFESKFNCNEEIILEDMNEIFDEWFVVLLANKMADRMTCH